MHEGRKKGGKKKEEKECREVYQHERERRNRRTRLFTYRFLTPCSGNPSR